MDTLDTLTRMTASIEGQLAAIRSTFDEHAPVLPDLRHNDAGEHMCDALAALNAAATAVAKAKAVLEGLGGRAVDGNNPRGGR